MINVYDVLNLHMIRTDTKVTIMLRTPGTASGCAVTTGKPTKSDVLAYQDYEVESFYYDSRRDVVVINVSGDLII